MTVSSTTRKSGPYFSDDSEGGAGVLFPFDFKVFSASDVCVTRTDTSGVDVTLTPGSDYSVALTPRQDPPGGSVSLGTPLPAGFRLTLTSNLAALQPIDITNSGGFYPDIVEAALDRQTILAQQVMETLGRSITLPVSLDPSISTRLGTPVPNGVLAWNSAGDQLITTTPEALAVSVNSDDVRAALLAATVTDSDTLRAPCGNAVFDAIAAEAAARDGADDDLNALIVIEANNRINAVNTLNTAIGNEATARSNGDALLLAKSDNLASLAAPATARSNLGLDAITARAWASFDGRYGTINHSSGIAGITRTSTGRYTVTFSTNMPHTGYVLTGTAASGSGGQPDCVHFELSSSSSYTNKSVGSCAIATSDTDNSNTFQDCFDVNIIFFA